MKLYDCMCCCMMIMIMCQVKPIGIQIMQCAEVCGVYLWKLICITCLTQCIRNEFVLYVNTDIPNATNPLRVIKMFVSSRSWFLQEYLGY